MSSVPPHARPESPPPSLPLGRGSAASRLFFSLEGAPMQACATRAGRASIEFDTKVAGRVSEVTTNGLELHDGPTTVALRHMLPDGLELTSLRGRWLVVRLLERLTAGRWTRQLEMRDARGRAVLVARDGALPHAREFLGVPLRVSVDAAGSELVLGSPPRARLSPGTVGAVTLQGQPLSLRLLRLGPDDVALLAVAA